mgnify:CR=1 FL=1
MPPNGYDTVTLPTDLIEKLDDYAGDSSRADAIRSLLSESDDGTDARITDIDDDVIDDLVSRFATETASEVEDRLR